MFGPGLRIRPQGQNGQPVATTKDCQCACHREAGEKPPEAVEARSCAGCAAEMFRPWTQVLESIS